MRSFKIDFKSPAGVYALIALVLLSWLIMAVTTAAARTSPGAGIALVTCFGALTIWNIAVLLKDKRRVGGSIRQAVRGRNGSKAGSHPFGELPGPSVSSIEVIHGLNGTTIDVAGKNIRAGASIGVEHDDKFVPLAPAGRKDQWTAVAPDGCIWFEHEVVMFVITNPNGQDTRTLWPPFTQAVIVRSPDNGAQAMR